MPGTQTIDVVDKNTSYDLIFYLFFTEYLYYMYTIAYTTKEGVIVFSGSRNLRCVYEILDNRVYIFEWLYRLIDCP